MTGYLSIRDLAAIVATLLAILAAIAIVPVAMEREERRICIQSEGWVRNNGAPETEVPEYCYERGFLERK